MRVLIVEDDDAIAELMRTIVEDEGWTCAACRSTYELPAGAFDVVVTDLGAGAYTRAAATAWVAPIHAAFPGVPVVIVTAHGAAKRDAKALEATRVVMKPFEIEDLTTAIRQATSHP